jgi:hypothetical protein
MTSDIPSHTHLREHESLYVLEGSVTVRVGDDEFPAGVGDFVFAPRGVPHAITATSDSQPRFLTVASPAASSTSWRTCPRRWPLAMRGGHPRWLRCARSTGGSRASNWSNRFAGPRSGILARRLTAVRDTEAGVAGAALGKCQPDEQLLHVAGDGAAQPVGQVAR